MIWSSLTPIAASVGAAFDDGGGPFTRFAYRPRRRGSRASRRPSPKKLSAITTLMMARPGKRRTTSIGAPSRRPA